MTLQKQPYYSFEDYLTIERTAIDEKHEYVAGDVFAMTGASLDHNLIRVNLAAALHGQLRGKPCTVQSNDLRIRIDAADACTYPDITVLCREPAFYDGRRDTVTNPTLIIEILSPSIESYDRGSKFALYRYLPSLEQYGLVAQDRLSVDLYTRQADNRWLLAAYERLDDQIELESIGCRVCLADLYEKVDLGGETPLG